MSCQPQGTKKRVRAMVFCGCGTTRYTLVLTGVVIVQWGSSGGSVCVCAVAPRGALMRSHAQWARATAHGAKGPKLKLERHSKPFAAQVDYGAALKQ